MLLSNTFTHPKQQKDEFNPSFSVSNDRFPMEISNFVYVKVSSMKGQRVKTTGISLHRLSTVSDSITMFVVSYSLSVGKGGKR